MQKAYNRINWANYPDDATPLNESNLNKMDAALDELDNRILNLDLTMQEPVTKSAENAEKAQGSAEAAAESESAAQASEEACLGALEEVRQKTVKTTFGVNFATGQLEYDAPGYVFAINYESGNLEWGVR